MVADADSSGKEKTAVDDLCMELIARERFGDTVTCAYCGGADVQEVGVVPQGIAAGCPKYACVECDRDSLFTNTIFSNREMPIVELCYILHQADEQSMLSSRPC
jgi:hypothetical protein